MPPPLWVASALREIGLSYADIFRQYHSLIEGPVRSQSVCVVCIVCLAFSLVKAHSYLGTVRGRKSFGTRVLERCI